MKTLFCIFSILAVGTISRGAMANPADYNVPHNEENHFSCEEDDNTLGKVVFGVQQGTLDIKIPLRGPGSLKNSSDELKRQSQRMNEFNKDPIRGHYRNAMSIYETIEEKEKALQHRLGLTPDYEVMAFEDHRPPRGLPALIPVISLAGKFLFQTLGMLKANLGPVVFTATLLAGGFWTVSQIAHHRSQSLNYAGYDIYYYDQERITMLEFDSKCFVEGARLDSIMTMISLGEAGVFHSGIFTPAMISNATAEFEEKLKQSSMKLVERLNLYDMPVQILLDPNNIIVRFAIPIMPKSFPEMCIHKYLLPPLVLENPRMIVQLKGKRDYLAVGGHFYREMNQADFDTCFIRKNRRYCPSSILKKGPHGCLSAVSSNQTSKALELCDMEIINEDPYVFQLSPTVYGAATLQPTHYSIHCGLQGNSRWGTVDGFAKINVESGCDLEIADTKVSSSQRIHTYFDHDFTKTVFQEFLNTFQATTNETAELAKLSDKARVNVKALYVRASFLDSYAVKLINFMISIFLLISLLLSFCVCAYHWYYERLRTCFNQWNERRNQPPPIQAVMMQPAQFDALQNQMAFNPNFNHNLYA